MQTEEFVAGRGVVTKWERIRRNNHWLDALYNACAAGHYAGVRLIEAQIPKRLTMTMVDPPKERKPHPWIDRDGWSGLRQF